MGQGVGGSHREGGRKESRGTGGEGYMGRGTGGEGYIGMLTGGGIQGKGT